MTVKETAIFLNEMSALYPSIMKNTEETKLALMGKLWAEAMKDYDFEVVRSALQTYFKQDIVGRIPTAGMLIELIEEKEERYADHEILHSGPMDRSKYTTKDGVFFGLEEIVIPRRK